jgi:hypothetical protein
MTFYVQDLYAKLGSIAALEKDWDSYGSDPIPPDIIENVRSFLTTHWYNAPLPNIIPCADGIDVEWRYPKLDLDICFRDNKAQDSYFFIAEPNMDDIERPLMTHGFIVHTYLELAKLGNFEG